MVSETPRPRRVLALAVALSLVAPLFAPATALAGDGPSAADRETARALMQEGRTRRERGDLKGALESFQAADAIMHVPTTGFEVARTHAARNELVEARDVLFRVIRSPARDSDPQPFKDAREKAQALYDELEARVPQVTIEVHGLEQGASYEASVDGIAVPPATLRLPRRLNPGRHVVSVRARGASAEQPFEIAEGETKRIDVRLEEAQRSVAAAASASDGAREGGSSWKTIAWVGFGVAGVGVVAGSVTGALSLSATRDAEALCAGARCPPPAHADIDRARSMATVSTVAFVAAGAGAAVGTLALVLSGRPREPTRDRRGESAKLLVEPWIAPGGAGLRGAF
jgi:hypothetical protein